MVRTAGPVARGNYPVAKESNGHPNQSEVVKGKASA